MKIETEDEYNRALRDAERLFDAAPGSAEERELVLLSDAIEVYEATHYPVGEPTDEEMAAYLAESRRRRVAAG